MDIQKIAQILKIAPLILLSGVKQEPKFYLNILEQVASMCLFQKKNNGCDKASRISTVKGI